jgi:hypothetical protein
MWWAIKHFLAQISIQHIQIYWHQRIFFYKRENLFILLCNIKREKVKRFVLTMFINFYELLVLSKFLREDLGVMGNG